MKIQIWSERLAGGWVSGEIYLASDRLFTCDLLFLLLGRFTVIMYGALEGST